jgi:hypothetical protein
MRFALEGDDLTGRTKDPTLDNPQGLGHPHPNFKTIQRLAHPPDKNFTTENTKNTEKASGREECSRAIL